MRLSRITDEEFIARIRRWHRTRRVWGAICFLVGLAFVLNTIYWLQHLSEKIEEFGNLLTYTQQPVDEHIRTSTESSRFLRGQINGFLLGKGVTGGTILAVIGFVTLVGSDRKTRILLECWEFRRDSS